MSLFLPVVAALMPILGYVVIGATLRWRFSDANFKALDLVSYRVFIPALLFMAAAARPIAAGTALRLVTATWLLLLLGLGLGLLAGRLSRLDPLETAARTQTAYRFNGIIGLAIAGLVSDSALQALSVVIGAAVRAANIFAIWVLSRGRALQGAADGAPKRLGPSVLRDIAFNPFFLASMGGIVFAASGLSVPPFLVGLLDGLAGSAVPVSLVAVGTSITFAGLVRMNGHVAALHAIKLLVLPLASLGIAAVFALSPGATAALLIGAAVPTAASAHVLAAEFGAAREGVAVMASQSTLLSLLSLPIWLAIAIAAFG